MEDHLVVSIFKSYTSNKMLCHVTIRRLLFITRPGFAQKNNIKSWDINGYHWLWRFLWFLWMCLNIGPPPKKMQHCYMENDCKFRDFGVWYPTQMLHGPPQKWPSYVGKYSSTREHLGYVQSDPPMKRNTHWKSEVRAWTWTRQNTRSAPDMARKKALQTSLKHQ